MERGIESMRKRVAQINQLKSDQSWQSASPWWGLLNEEKKNGKWAIWLSFRQRLRWCMEDTGLFALHPTLFHYREVDGTLLAKQSRSLLEYLNMTGGAARWTMSSKGQQVDFIWGTFEVSVIIKHLWGCYLNKREILESIYMALFEKQGISMDIGCSRGTQGLWDETEDIYLP